jgi:hypothetical protein
LNSGLLHFGLLHSGLLFFGLLFFVLLFFGLLFFGLLFSDLLYSGPLTLLAAVLAVRSVGAVDTSVHAGPVLNVALAVQTGLAALHGAIRSVHPVILAPIRAKAVGAALS